MQSSPDMKTNFMRLIVSAFLLPVLAAAGPSPSEKLTQREIAAEVKKGVQFLLKNQLPDGGWAGSEPSRQRSEKGDVANTSMAVLALMRAGHTPAGGEHKQSVVRGLELILTRVEESDPLDLYVEPQRNTQVQYKIGTHVDTFVSVLAMAEARMWTKGTPLDDRLNAGLLKVTYKIQRNQSPDGTFPGNRGWASALSQGLAGKALHKARESGIDVSDEVLEKIHAQAYAGLDPKTGRFVGDVRGVSTAGIRLYDIGARVGTAAQARSAGFATERALLAELPKSSPARKKVIKARLASIREDRTRGETIAAGLRTDITGANFANGFGNQGGEEYLSFLNISELLSGVGGDNWVTWDKSTTQTIEMAQNADGSWSGKHCITGRTFCTAAAILTLLTGPTA